MKKLIKIPDIKINGYGIYYYQEENRDDKNLMSELIKEAIIDCKDISDGVKIKIPLNNITLEDFPEL